MKNVEIEVPVELNGLVADVSVNFQIDQRNRAQCLDNLRGFVRFSGERVHLEGNFDMQELAAVMLFLDEGE